MKTIISLVLVISSQTFTMSETEANLMPEVTHSADSMKTYSTPKASLGRKVEAKKDEFHAQKEKTTQTAHLNKKQ